MPKPAEPERRSYHHGDLRSALIAAAENLMRAQEGWTFTLREVARAAGVSHNAPYNHFSDRLALLAAVAARAFDDFRIAMETAVGEGDAKRRLLASARGYVGFAVANPARFRLMFGSELAAYRDVTLDAARAQSFDVLKRLIDDGVAAGTFRADPHGTHALAAWSLVHGLGSLVLDRMVACPSDEAGLAALTEAVGMTLCEGLTGAAPHGGESRRPASDGPVASILCSPPERQPR